MEEQGKSKDTSSFWLGLIIGAAVAGFFLYFLEKDKTEKKQFLQNLKNDWEKIVKRMKNLTAGENLKEPPQAKNEQPLAINGLAEKTTPLKTSSPKARKFFKKAGKKLV